MMLYLGSDNALPLIEWQSKKKQSIFKKEQEKPQLLSVYDLDGSNKDDRFVSEQLTKKYQYYVGSWESCGCGFQFDYTNEEFETDGNELGKQSLEALFDYICKYVQGDNCELFSMWAGEYKAEYRNVIDLRDFKFGDSFRFLEGQYITVYK